MRTALFCRTETTSTAFTFLWFNRGTCKIWLLFIHSYPMTVQVRRVQVVLESLHKCVQAREIPWSLHTAKERKKKTCKPPLQVSLWLFNRSDRCPSSLSGFYGLRRYVLPASAVPTFVMCNLESEAFTNTWSLCSIILFNISNYNHVGTRNTLQQEKNDLIIIKKHEQCSSCQLC